MLFSVFVYRFHHLQIFAIFYFSFLLVFVFFGWLLREYLCDIYLTAIFSWNKDFSFVFLHHRHLLYNLLHVCVCCLVFCFLRYPTKFLFLLPFNNASKNVFLFFVILSLWLLYDSFHAPVLYFIVYMLMSIWRFNVTFLFHSIVYINYLNGRA